MCTLHQRKIATPYARIDYTERKLVDEAWAAARAATKRHSIPVGVAIRASSERGVMIFDSTDTLDEPANIGLHSAHKAVAAGYIEFKSIAIVADENYWPSRDVIIRLGQHAAGPDTDVLFVDHRSGLVKRWSVKQLLDCELTSHYRETVEKSAALPR
jgi:hypothetical protein